MPYAPEYLHLVIPGVTFEALLYGRNSDDAIGRGNSVDDQLTNGRTLCGQHGWKIVREFKDTDMSASRHGRKARDDFEALITYIKSEPTPPGARRVVVAFEASRYYRDLEAYVRLRAACMSTDTLLCYNGQVFDLSKREDRKATAQDAIAAEDEAEGIRDRNLRTAGLQAQAGMPHGKSIYGYTRTYDMVNGRKRCTGQEEDERGPYVLEMLRRLDSGHTLGAVKRWLRSEPDAARLDGHPWTEQSVRMTVLNRAYLGERLHQGQYIKAVWAPIKGLETPQGRAMFFRVTARITDPTRTKHRGTEVAHLLTYIPLCGECGDHARLRYLTPARGRKNATLACTEKYDTSIVEAVLNAYVEEAIIAWFSNKAKARAALVPSDGKVEEMVTATQRLINSYEEQLAEARHLAETFDDQAGRFKLSATSLAGMEARIEPKLEAERKKLQSFTGTSPLLLRMLDEDPETVWNGRPASADRPAAPGLTLEQKREIIQSVVTVRLYKVKTPGDRIRLAFAGERGFRDRPLRAPATAPARLPGPRAASSGTSEGSLAGAAGAS
ncbi:recombinase family protein [Streptomyces sp. M92]|uniref:recombinase family protein n=1 Tax=Streptomyces sp. M92 TaxID=2944250 RepID=UPI00234AC3A0|nr:recombinase family protein [Streptomyces sp. M92]WCN06002.1 recombinase family protein [Streptomyces sp. M92]